MEGLVLAKHLLAVRNTTEGRAYVASRMPELSGCAERYWALAAHSIDDTVASTMAALAVDIERAACEVQRTFQL